MGEVGLSDTAMRDWLRDSAQAMLEDAELRAHLPEDLIAALQDLLQPQPTAAQLELGMLAVTAVNAALAEVPETGLDALLTDLPDIIQVWFKTPSWPASRRWLAARINELPANTAEQLETLALRANESDAPNGAETLLRHAALLRAARATDVESAYQTIIGPEAFAEEDDVVEALRARVILLQTWLSTPDWDASRAFLAAHSDELLDDDAEGLLTLMADAESRTDAQNILDDHIHLIRQARQIGIDAAYDDFLADDEQEE